MMDRLPYEDLDAATGFTMSGLHIIPTLGLSVGYDDNITRASTHQISSSFYMVSPAVHAELPFEQFVFSLAAAAEIVRYQDSPIDDRLSWHVRPELAWFITQHQELDVFAQYSVGSDRRGTGRRQGDVGLVPLPPDEWKLSDIGGEWDYGAVGSHGRLTLYGGASDLEYTNNRGIGDFAGTRALDRDRWFYGGTFYWRVAPKTSLLLDYGVNDISYKLSDDLDSVETSWMAGVTWDATARTSGRIAYGYLNKDFDDPTRGDYKGPVWELSVNWRPRTYSVFTLSGGRSTRETDGSGDYILYQGVTFSWIHDWAERFGTTVDVGVSEDKYLPTDRVDDYFYWGVGLRYRFNSHLRFGASVVSDRRDSEETRFDYEQVVYMVSLGVSF
jgi:hypothetical protein